MIGVGRIILEPGGKRGEFAVVVGDPWQGLGLGSKLFDYIVQIGKDANLESIYGYVSSGNSRMIDMCVNRGFRMQPFDEETLKATLELVQARRES
jgi:acetyltransferase